MILIEGLANVALMAFKLALGTATGSLALIGDALHSATDLANNVVAWFVARLASNPPDRDHPYGHERFETLAVFGLGMMLTVLAIELARASFGPREAPRGTEPVFLLAMAGVLAVNLALATWQSAMARKLSSPILQADARHTLSDVLVTAAVLAGWQLSARGLVWADRAAALAVAALVLALAFGLFRRAIPVLTGRMAVDPDALESAAVAVPGVSGVGRVRSRFEGSIRAADLVVRVDGRLSTEASHEVADRVEAALRRELDVDDVTIHVEPESD